MSNQINYKQKYQELKAKFMDSVDAAFRLGFEQGSQQAQMDQAMQQQQQAEEAAAQGAQPGQGFGAEGSPAGEEQQANPNGGPVAPMQESENPAGSELDQHIAKLESMLGKSEQLDVKDLIKTVNDLKALQKSQKEQIEMRKSSMAIPEIAKNLHKPAFKIGVQASHNLTSNAKAAVNMQEKIVSDIMKSWAEEEQKAAASIKQIVNIENLSKKE